MAVVEKAISYGLEGALATEVKAALYALNGARPIAANFIVGLGGKDVKPVELCEAARRTLSLESQLQAPAHPIWLSNEI